MVDEVAVNKFRKLVESLYLRTEDKSLKWVESPFLGGVEVLIGDKVVNLNVVNTSANVPDYEVRIVNSVDYTTIDSFKDTDIYDERDPEVLGFPSYFKVMETTYNMIQRRLSGSDAAIDDLLEHLK